MSLLDKAIGYSAVGHSGQFDKGGKPYVLHTLAVMQKVMQYTDDDAVHCAAVMHDLIEDTDISLGELLSVFGERIAQYILNVTKMEGQTHEEYMERVCSCKESMLIKLCDIEHNSDIRRLKGLTEKDFKRVVKYQKDYHLLKQKLKDQYGIGG